MRLFLILVTITISSTAKANDPCASGCGVPAQRAYRGIVHQIMEFTDAPTPRETVPDYATSHDLDPEKLEAAVAATSNLNCDGNLLSANVVGHPRVLATAGHALNDLATCEKIANATDCHFIPREGATPIKVIKNFDSGFKCPKLPGPGDDWAVFILEKSAGVKEYALPKDDGASMVDGRRVVTVGAFSVDFPLRDKVTKQIIKNPRTGKPIFPKHMQDCTVERVYYKFDPPYFSEKCDGASGRSGGATVDFKTPQPTLLAIHSGNNLSKTLSAQEKEKAAPARGQFNERTFVSGSTVVAGKFLSALEDAVKFVSR